eukprot:2911572-Pyramimonas_sp.AAC.1
MPALSAAFRRALKFKGATVADLSQGLPVVGHGALQATPTDWANFWSIQPEPLRPIRSSGMSIQLSRCL